MTSEEVRKEELKDQFMQVRDDFCDLRRNSGWKRVVKRIDQSITNGKVDLCLIKKTADMSEVRFLQGQMYALTGLINFVEKNSEADDDELMVAVNDQYDMEVRKNAEMDE